MLISLFMKDNAKKMQLLTWTYEKSMYLDIYIQRIEAYSES